MGSSGGVRAYHRHMVRRVVVVAFLALLTGCDEGGGGGGGLPGADGTERGACYGNGTCNEGLVCLSNRCVRPPGAKCEEVGEALAALDLGNYAPKDQRAARVEEIAAMCRAQHMTKSEGACVLEKTTKEELAECPKPLIVKPLSDQERKALAATGLPGVCSEYLRLLDRYASCSKLPPETQRALRQSVDQMKQQWKDLTGAGGQQVNDACKQGIDAMRQAMNQMGC
jgi:hypothetical protein